MMSHEQARDLLPWLVNESLAVDERDRVRDHATSCVICRQELAELERVRDSIAVVTDSAVTPTPDMRRINARIDALIDKEHRGRRLMRTLTEFLQSPWRTAFAVQTLLVIGLLAILLRPEPQAVEFTTLTTPETLPSGDYIRIVFDPDLDAVDVAAILEGTGLEILTGPSERGVAMLHFESTPDPQKRDGTLRRLLESPGVLFAEPVTGGPG